MCHFFKKKSKLATVFLHSCGHICAITVVLKCSQAWHFNDWIKNCMFFLLSYLVSVCSSFVDHQRSTHNKHGNWVARSFLLCNRFLLLYALIFLFFLHLHKGVDQEMKLVLENVNYANKKSFLSHWGKLPPKVCVHLNREVNHLPVYSQIHPIASKMSSF